MENAQPKKYNSLGLAVRDNSIEGAKDVLATLAERKQYINSEEWTTLLFKTLDTLSPEMAAFLKEQGADITASLSSQGPDERTQVFSLGYATIMSKNRNLMEWMLAEGWIDEQAMVSPAGDTVLVQAVREHAFEIAEMCIQRGMSIDHQNLRGVSALHEAASHGDYLSLEWLMEKNANPTTETMDGAVPCELVPEESEEPGEAERLFEAIDEYYRDYKAAAKQGSLHLVQVPQFIAMKAATIKAENAPDQPDQPKRASLRA